MAPARLAPPEARTTATKEGTVIERSVRAGDPFAYAGQGEARKNGEHPPTPPGSTPTTREQRGLALFRERGDEIEHLNGQRWAVPSCSGEHRYAADLRHQTCSCEDSIWQDGGCKHIVAATIARSKTAECAGCGRRHRRRDLLELIEGEHDGLTFFDGDLLCGGCARAHGVL